MEERIVHDLVQGSPEWDQFRLEHDGASEIAAVLGLSKKTLRNELLRIKHTGIAKEFSAFVQENILDYGHEVEAQARPIIEEMIGEKLYPATYSMGRLSASCDGITMSDAIAFEHKQWNEEIAAIVSEGEVPPEHMPQCQQILMVTGAERLLFCVSNGTKEQMWHVWVLPDPEWFKRIRAGWDQFHDDLRNYVLKDAVVKPAATVEGVYLPAVSVRITGELTVVDNLDEMATVVRDFIDSKLIRKPVTDLDFVNLDRQIKGMKEVEAELDKAEEEMISQTGPIRGRLQLKEAIHSLVRLNRLASEKLYDAEKTNRKNQIVQSGKDRFAEHIASLNERFPTPYMPSIPVDFALAIKGKRDLAVMENAIDTELANAKIRANEIADQIDRNLKLIGAVGDNYAHLFNDVASLVLKASDDLANVIQVRKAGEDSRLSKVKSDAEEAERNRLAEAEELRKKQEQTAAPVQPVEPAQAASPVTAGRVDLPLRSPDAGSPMVMMKLGDINAALGLTVSADFLASLGFHATTDKNAKLYAASLFPAICNAIVIHINSVSAQRQLKAA